MKTTPLITRTLLLLLLVTVPAAAGDGDWQTLHDEAIALMEAGDRDAARLRLLDAMTAADEAGVPHLFFEQSMVDLARCQQRAGQFGEAEVQYRRALVVRAARLGAWHPDIASLLGELALVCAAQRDFDRAALFTKRVLAIQEKALGLDHLDVGVTLYRLGSYAIEQGRVVEAEAYFARSLPITSGVLEDGGDLAGTLTTFASIQRARRRHGVAEALYRRAIELRRAEGPAASGDVQTLLSLYGSLCEERDDWAQAAHVYRQAFDAQPSDRLAARLWWATARQGDRRDADRFLTRYTATRSSDRTIADWSGKILYFLLGHIEADDLLTSAERAPAELRPERRCEAHFYIGSRHYVRGETDLAAERFRACVGTEVHSVPEYRSAQAELERLDPAIRVTTVDQLPYDPDW